VSHFYPVDENELDNETEADGRHCKIMTGKLQAGNAQQDAADPPHGRTAEHPKPYGDAESHRKQGRGIGTDPHEGHLSQIDLARVAQENVQSQAGDAHHTAVIQ